MKVRVLSDLHLEFTNYLPAELSSCGEDLVVLAGDIGVGTQGIEWAKQAIPDRPVVYVLGNHEFYKQDWDLLLEQARAASAGSNVRVLENESVEIAGLRILGCSLWTDFRVMGALTQATAIAMAQHEMTDFRLIRRARKTARIMPMHMIQRCEESRRWLESQISTSDRPLLVVTHHAPTLKTVNPKFLLALSNAAFHNDFEDLVRPPVVAWIHGHTHHSCDLDVSGIRMVSNQRGYPGESGCDFRWDFVIEVMAEMDVDRERAEAVIGEAEPILLSEKDYLAVLNILENPPAPNARLRKAIARYLGRDDDSADQQP